MFSVASRLLREAHFSLGASPPSRPQLALEAAKQPAFPHQSLAPPPTMFCMAAQRHCLLAPHGAVPCLDDQPVGPAMVLPARVFAYGELVDCLCGERMAVKTSLAGQEMARMRIGCVLELEPERAQENISHLLHLTEGQGNTD